MHGFSHHRSESVLLTDVKTDCKVFPALSSAMGTFNCKMTPREIVWVHSTLPQPHLLLHGFIPMLCFMVGHRECTKMCIGFAVAHTSEGYAQFVQARYNSVAINLILSAVELLAQWILEQVTWLGIV